MGITLPAEHGGSELETNGCLLLLMGGHTFSSVTKPDVGIEMYKLKTRAIKQGDRYIVIGQKMQSEIIALIDTEMDLLRRVVSPELPYLIPKRQLSASHYFYTHPTSRYTSPFASADSP